MTPSIDQALHQFLTLLLILTLLPNLTFYLIARGFHRTFATGAACQQRTLTPPDTWSCPTLGLASVLMLRPIYPELVLFLDFWVSNIPRYFCFCFTNWCNVWSFFLKKGTPVACFRFALDPPLGGSRQKTTTLVRDLEYYLHTKIYQNPSSGSWAEVENVKCLTEDGWTTYDGRTTDCQYIIYNITIGHWSLRLLC